MGLSNVLLISKDFVCYLGTEIQHFSPNKQNHFTWNEKYILLNCSDWFLDQRINSLYLQFHFWSKNKYLDHTYFYIISIWINEFEVVATPFYKYILLFEVIHSSTWAHCFASDQVAKCLFIFDLIFHMSAAPAYIGLVQWCNFLP